VHSGFTGLTITRLEAGMDGVCRFRARDIVLPPGCAVAVIGPSGAGKSTLLKTLGGLIAPLSWTGPETWTQTAAAASMVSQEPFLFDDTVDANLRYGLGPDEEPSLDDVARALATVNLSAEIAALPLGLATPVRAIGSNVSGGQLQRLCIARGLLRDRPLWLLDEATSAIDPRTEREITQRVIAACRAQGRVLLSVTHRLQFLAEYDEIWFVEAGELRLRGTHAELLADARYRRYCADAEADDA
jgi:ATP-binding cassette subfamily C protein CydC